MNPSKSVRSLFDVHPDERRIAALMCSYFFLVITSFWILKPIKKTLFIGYYADSGFAAFDFHLSASKAELLAKVLNMVVAAVAALAFSTLSRRLRRQQLTYVFSGFFVVFYGVFAVFLMHPGGLTVWSFYLFGDLFSTLMVATFFAFLNDSVSSDAAKRLYGIVGFGGVAGGVFGSSAVALWIASLSLPEWLGITTLLAGAIVLIARAAGQSLPSSARPESASAFVVQRENAAEAAAGSGSASSEAPEEFGSALAGVRHVFGSPYLLSIVAIVGLYELVSTLVDFQFTTAMVAFSEDATSRDQNFATVFATTNWLSLCVQLFLTSYVMRRFGLATALMVLPCAIALSSMGFLVAPSLIFGGLLSVADNGFSYSINQSSKEALYVPTTAQEKYQAKAFIDMFVQRFAKAVAVGLGLVVTNYFADVEGVRKLTFFVLPVLGVWAFAAIYAGRRFRELEERDTKAV